MYLQTWNQFNSISSVGMFIQGLYHWMYGSIIFCMKTKYDKKLFWCSITIVVVFFFCSFYYFVKAYSLNFVSIKLGLNFRWICVWEMDVWKHVRTDQSVLLNFIWLAHKKNLWHWAWTLIDQVWITGVCTLGLQHSSWWGRSGWK